MKHIKFRYDENGDIDWDKTVIPVVDLTQLKFENVDPSPEDQKLFQKLNER